jgi:hypothetical protein
MKRIFFFNLPNRSSRAMALGRTQPLTEMRTRNLSGGKGRPESKADKLTAICEQIVYKKCGSLDVSQPYGPYFLLSCAVTLWAGIPFVPLQLLQCMVVWVSIAVTPEVVVGGETYPGILAEAPRGIPVLPCKPILRQRRPYSNSLYTDNS